MKNKLILVFSVIWILNLDNDSFAQENFFSEKITITEGEIWDIDFEDLNDDGKIDIVVSDYKKPPAIFYNSEGGSFYKTQYLICDTTNDGLTTGHGIAIGDLDNDGDPDIFSVFNDLSSIVYLNKKERTYVINQRIGDLKENGTSISLADVDQDMDLDAFITYFQKPTKLWINKGNGNFQDSQKNFGNDCCCVALGDIDNDGDLDVISSRVYNKSIIWFNEGNNNYKQSDQKIGDSVGYGKIELIDIDNDKDQDIIIANGKNGCAIYLNDGTGNFSVANNRFNKSVSLAVGDLDSDRDFDLIIGNKIWQSNSNMDFQIIQELDINNPVGLWLKDIDNDNDLDLLVSVISFETGLGELILYHNTKGN